MRNHQKRPACVSSQHRSPFVRWTLWLFVCCIQHCKSCVCRLSPSQGQYHYSDM